MISQLRLHTWAHLKFFQRNRLVLGLVVAGAALWMLGFVPFLMLESSGGKFERLKYLSSQMHALAWFYGGLLALIAISSHLRDRSTRLVFTRPNPPELWMASIMISASLVSLVVHGLTVALILGLSVAWGIPYQIGFLWIALDAAIETLVVISLVTMLGTAIHPVLAAFVMVIFNDQLFYFLYSMLAASIQAGGAGVWVSVGRSVIRIVYSVIPMLDPFSDKTQMVNASLRVRGVDWAFLAATAAYAATMTAFCFFAATLTLRRRTL